MPSSQTAGDASTNCRYPCGLQMASLSTAAPQRLPSGMRVGRGTHVWGKEEQNPTSSIRDRRLLRWAAQSRPSPCDPTDCSPQALLSVGVSGQEYRSRLPCPPPGGLPDTGMEPGSPAWQVGSLPSKPMGG